MTVRDKMKNIKMKISQGLCFTNQAMKKNGMFYWASSLYKVHVQCSVIYIDSACDKI